MMNHAQVVLDACTIINLLRIDDVVTGNLYKCLKSLKPHVAGKVCEEARANALRNSIDEDHKEYIRNQLTRLHTDFVIHSDDEIIKAFEEGNINKVIAFSEYKKSGYNGELYSTLMSLILSRSNESKVVFYTDDYPAKEQFSKLFEFQQIGWIDDSVCLLTTLYWMKSDFTKVKFRKALRDLRAEYTGQMNSFITVVKEEKANLNRRDAKYTILSKIEAEYDNPKGNLDNIATLVDRLGNVTIKRKFKAVESIGGGRIVSRINETLQNIERLELYKKA